jgi:DNA-binding PadR family transcriptional regulator
MSEQKTIEKCYKITEKGKKKLEEKGKWTEIIDLLLYIEGAGDNGTIMEILKKDIDEGIELMEGDKNDEEFKTRCNLLANLDKFLEQAIKDGYVKAEDVEVVE